MAALDQWYLARSDDFRGRVLVMMVYVAIQVQGESRDNPPSEQQLRRSLYAKALLNDPVLYLDRVLYATVADTAISTTSNDTTLLNRVSAIFNALAGMV
jgi:hypothetical protein